MLSRTQTIRITVVPLLIGDGLGNPLRNSSAFQVTQVSFFFSTLFLQSALASQPFWSLQICSHWLIPDNGRYQMLSSVVECYRETTESTYLFRWTCIISRSPIASGLGSLFPLFVYCSAIVFPANPVMSRSKNSVVPRWVRIFLIRKIIFARRVRLFFFLLLQGIGYHNDSLVLEYQTTF